MKNAINTFKAFVFQLITFIALVFESMRKMLGIFSDAFINKAMQSWDVKSTLARYTPYLLVAMYFLCPKFLFGLLYFIGFLMMSSFVSVVTVIVIVFIVNDLVALAKKDWSNFSLNKAFAF